MGKNWQSETGKFSYLYPKPKSGSLLFAGDSHIEQCEWHELFTEKSVYNRGIGSEQSGHLLFRISQVMHDSMVIVIQTGINDLISGIPIDSVAENHKKVTFLAESKHCRILPTLVFYSRFLPDVNEKVFALNQKLRKFYTGKNIPVIDLNPELAHRNRLSAKYSTDGLHLNYLGYQLWAAEIRKALNLQQDSCCR